MTLISNVKNQKRNGHCPGRIHVLSQWNNLNQMRYKYGKIINPNHTHAPCPDNPTVRYI